MKLFHTPEVGEPVPPNSAEPHWIRRFLLTPPIISGIDMYPFTPKTPEHTPALAISSKPTFDRSYSTAINDRAVARLKVTVPEDFGTTLPTMNVLAIKNKVRNSPPLSP